MAKGENKASEVGMVHAKGGLGTKTVHEIEHYNHVGSPAGKGVRFKMPTDVTDHSCVRSPEHK
jgi:hypothetical protein